MDKRRKLSDIQYAEIATLYLEKLSSIEICELYQKRGVDISVRQIQRIIKGQGINRSIGDAFRLAIQRGRVKFTQRERKNLTRRTKLNPSLRYKILQRDNFRCVLCGADSSVDTLEVDHVNNQPDDHRPINLRTLCHLCNFGRPSPNRKGSFISI